MVAKQRDDIPIVNIDMNFQVFKLWLCANCGCSSPDGTGGVYRETGRQFWCVILRVTVN